MPTAKPTTPSDVLEDLILAILAVNNYPLEKAFALRDRLRAQGWMEPQRVAKLSHEDAVAALKAAGYDRGPTMNSIFASRLQELGQFVVKHGLDTIATPLKAGKKDQVEALLLDLHGIGPAVVRNFWLLQGDDG